MFWSRGEHTNVLPFWVETLAGTWSISALLQSRDSLKSLGTLESLGSVVTWDWSCISVTVFGTISFTTWVRRGTVFWIALDTITALVEEVVTVQYPWLARAILSGECWTWFVQNVVENVGGWVKEDAFSSQMDFIGKFKAEPFKEVVWIFGVLFEIGGDVASWDIPGWSPLTTVLGDLHLWWNEPTPSVTGAREL